MKISPGRTDILINRHLFLKINENSLIDTYTPELTIKNLNNFKPILNLYWVMYEILKA